MFFSDPSGLTTQEGEQEPPKLNGIVLDEVVIVKPPKKNTGSPFMDMSFAPLISSAGGLGFGIIGNNGSGVGAIGIGPYSIAGHVPLGNNDPIVGSMLKNYSSYNLQNPPNSQQNSVSNQSVNDPFFNTLIFDLLKWENGDGFITVEEAINTWRYGRGQQHLRADLSQLDLSKVSVSDFPLGEGSTIYINFASKKYFTNTNQAVIYGNISLTLINNNTVFVPYQDKYDFDIRGGWTNIRRDILTVWGNIYNSYGTPYYITIYGTAKIKP